LSRSLDAPCNGITIISLPVPSFLAFDQRSALLFIEYHDYPSSLFRNEKILILHPFCVFFSSFFTLLCDVFSMGKAAGSVWD